MARFNSVKQLRLWVAAVCLFVSNSPCAGQFTDRKPSELTKAVFEHLKQGKPEAALALVNQKAAAPDASADVADTMFVLSKDFFRRKQYDQSLELLKGITTKFPTSATASLAWCGMGQVYEKRGDEANMIAALERGMDASRVLTQTNIMDADDTHGYACQRLGAHYLAKREWAKALDVYTRWKPSSWCGTCLDGMQSRRQDLIRLCRARLGQFDAAVEQAWRQIASDQFIDDELSLFVLVRLYAEAKQLNDLRLLNLQALAGAIQRFPVGKNEDNQQRIQTLLKRFSSLADAIDLAERSHRDDDLDLLAAEHRIPSVIRHVARWDLFRYRDSTVPDIELAVLRSDSHGYPYLEILAAIDSPESRKAMVDLAIDGDIGRQQGVCGFIRHWMKNPEPLIAQIAAGVPEDRARQTNANFDGKRFEFSFYEDWTPPASNSLPKTLPRNLFEK